MEAVVYAARQTPHAQEDGETCATLPDLEHAKSAVLSSLNYPPKEDTTRIISRR